MLGAAFGVGRTMSWNRECFVDISSETAPTVLTQTGARSRGRYKITNVFASELASAIESVIRTHDCGIPAGNIYPLNSIIRAILRVRCLSSLRLQSLLRERKKDLR